MRKESTIFRDIIATYVRQENEESIAHSGLGPSDGTTDLATSGARYVASAASDFGV